MQIARTEVIVGANIQTRKIRRSEKDTSASAIIK
jgi:hypothetical protein